MKRMKTVAILTAGLLCIASLSGCGGSQAATSESQTVDNSKSDVSSTSEATSSSAASGGTAGGTVKIACMAPLSGANADGGQQDLDAIKLAVQDINNAGGIQSLGGAKIELVVADVTSDATQCTQIAERTISSNDLSGIVGTSISGLTIPILPIIEKYGIPTITNSINDQITEQGYEYIFETVPKGSHFGQQQVAFIQYLQEQGYPANKVAIIYENSSYGQSTAAGSLEIAQSAGLDVVMNESFPPNFSDASSLVTSLKNSGAEIVMPVAYSQDAKLIVNTMNAMDCHPLIIGGGAGFLWPVLGEEMGDSVNGLISVGSWNWDSKNISENPALLKVTEDFEQLYGYFMTEHSGPSYVATWILKEGLEKAASTDPKAVRDAIASLSFTEGPVSMMQPGMVEWDETGWNKDVTPVMIQWQDGKPRTIFPTEFSVTKIQMPNK